MGPDDYLIVGSLVLACGMAVSYNEEAKNGFGLHMHEVDYHHKVEAFKWFFVAQILYKIASGLTKCSILCLYLRIFPSRNFRISAWTTMGVVAAYSFAAVMATIFQCTPLRKAWDKKLSGHCLNIGGVWYGTSVMAIVTDLAVIVLPIYQIRRLRLPLSQKVALGLLFSLGFFVVACTVVRMCVVGPAITATDVTYYQAISNSWTFLEVNVGIICACLPILKAPVVKFFPCIMRNKTTNNVSEMSGSRFTTYQSRNRMSYPQRSRSDKTVESDEEFILGDIGIKKTTDIGVSFAEMPPEGLPKAY